MSLLAARYIFRITSLWGRKDNTLSGTLQFISKTQSLGKFWVKCALKVFSRWDNFARSWEYLLSPTFQWLYWKVKPESSLLSYWEILVDVHVVLVFLMKNWYLQLCGWQIVVLILEWKNRKIHKLWDSLSPFLHERFPRLVITLGRKKDPSGNWNTSSVGHKGKRFLLEKIPHALGLQVLCGV